MLTDEQIASVCHEANKAYCLAIGDDSQNHWTALGDFQADFITRGVTFARSSPDLSEEELHAAWMESKLADGWVYGETKSEPAKTHPCLVPYDQLPAEQKVKDRLFRAIVTALTA